LARLCYNVEVGLFFTTVEVYYENYIVCACSILCGPLQIEEISRMITKCKVEPGNVYRFVYDGSTRIAWVLDQQSYGNFLCWDFTSEGYRSFNRSRMYSVEDMTNRAAIRDTHEVSSERLAKWDRMNDIHVHFEHGQVCSVRF
jgi:hypothetical protein